MKRMRNVIVIILCICIICIYNQENAFASGLMKTDAVQDENMDTETEIINTQPNENDEDDQIATEDTLGSTLESQSESQIELETESMEQTFSESDSTLADEESRELLNNYAETAENIESSDDSASMSEEVSDEDVRKENSWRFEDGMWLGAYGVTPYSFNGIEPWTKVDGSYINSGGEVVVGALARGIDVSEWQGKIDWERVIKDDVSFAIIRCGSSLTYDDKYWNYNVSECERLGIPYGVYFYSYADDVEEARKEAEHALRLLAGHSPSLPVYLDLEDDAILYETLPDGGKRQRKPAEIAEIASVFCDTVAASGYSVSVYANKNWWENYLTDPYFGQFSEKRWVAQYNEVCTYSGDYMIWQCSSTGSIDGINGNVDLDLIYVPVPNGGGSDEPSVDDNFGVEYQTHVQTYGWQNWVQNGQTSGTTNQSKRLEGIKIQLKNAPYPGEIQYQTHVQTYGWQNWVQNGQISGTTNQSKRLEAIKIQLTGEIAEHYDIYYRVHAQKLGWLGWAKNGESAGTAGYSYRLEAIQIQLVEKGGSAPGETTNSFVQRFLKYQTHVQTYGWQDIKYDGETSGTTGLSKRLEGIKISLYNQPYSGNIEYKTHVQTYGWQDWTENNQISGTTGMSKRLEAIQIRLTGEMSDYYDIYYRVHAQQFGWLDWAKNGESAGTAGYSYRLEGIEIVVVPKGAAAPGSTAKPFYEK